MKTFFTFLLILLVSANNYAQKTGSSIQKAGTQPSAIAAGSQLFSINKVFPNPAKDFITIELQSDKSGAIQISLINILGVEVKRWDGLFLDQGEQKMRIDLTSVKNGVYFLRISQSDQVRTQVLKKI
jgi:hypothetical protein